MDQPTIQCCDGRVQLGQACGRCGVIAATPWTLRFTEWQCGHHGERPDDIPVASPQQAKLILTAISHAISQPGHARAMLFGETRGWADIYVTDDYCEFNPNSNPSYRPEVILCADEATAAAILGPELKAARETVVDPDPYRARMWAGEDTVETNDCVVTLLTHAQVEERVQIADWRADADTNKPRSFELPPIYFDGAQVLEKLRAEAASIAEWEAERAAEHQREVDADEAADRTREEQRLDPPQGDPEP